MNRQSPNVVLILTDDQGWGDLSRTGNANLCTPRVDQLAADGATMEWFYVQPLCAPTRAEILTGRYYPRTGVKGVCLGAERLNLDEVTLADLFRDAGYHTGCFGKWHSGQQYPYHPNGRGFDQFVGFCCGHWSHYFDSTIERNGIEFQSEGYLPDVLTDYALEFIAEKQDEPFFCYLPLNTPHSPFQVPDEYYDRFKDNPLALRSTHPEREDSDVTRAALAMCENIDWNVGRVVDRLEALGLRENTIVIYLSDNGPNTWRWNGGMAGRKGDAEEGGVRSPCSITWPGYIPAGTVVDRIAGAIDLLPTLADLCDVDTSATKPLDGVSLRPLLTGDCKADDWPDRQIFARQANDRPAISVRTQEFRAGGALGGLYRPAEDLPQASDLSRVLPNEHDGLMEAIANWEAEMPVNPVYSALPVGYREFPHAYIPTQDAVLQGGLRRSSIHPNCSFIQDWEDTDASITWSLDVKQAGDYEVEAMYACSEAEVGSVLEVRSGSHAVQATLTEPFTSVLKDQDDRVVREESYDKAFKPLPMGVLQLESGLQPLVLKCLSKTGNSVGEIRALKLTYKGEQN
jgi:arylsulfatase A-like enzyme